MINIDETRKDANFLRKDEPKAIPIAQRRKTEPSRVMQIAKERAMNEFQEAAKTVIAAYETSKKAAALDPLERTLAAKIYKVLQRLKRQLLAASTLSEAEPAAEVSPEDQARYNKLWNILTDIDFKDFDYMNLTYDETNRAFVEGWENGKEPLIGQNPNLVGSFGSVHPDVVQASYRVRAAARVTAVSAETKSEIRNLLSLGRVEGTSYAQFARELSGSFAFSRDRAHLIAVTELADAYEEGNSAPSKMLSNIGFQMQKSWLLLADEKVCPLCVENQSVGWIPEEDDFPHGGDHPPAHPRCRCAADRRMDPESSMPQAPEPNLPVGQYRDFAGDESEMEIWAYGSELSGTRPAWDPDAVLQLNTSGPFSGGFARTGGAYGQWNASLTEDERMSILSYADEGYQDMNNYLSGNYAEISELDFAKNRVDALVSALSRAETPEDLVTYKGGMSKGLVRPKVGDTIDYYEFKSTTLNQAKAVDFATSRGTFTPTGGIPSSGEVPTYYKMLVPKGAHAAYLGAELGIPEERELLFQKGTRWRVLSDDIVTVKDTYGKEYTLHQLTMELMNGALDDLPEPSADDIAEWDIGNASYSEGEFAP